MQDVPSLRAEFGHPDVAIALTCLSYYYGGLTKDQVLLCFDLLAKLDNPETEYDHWVGLGHDLPTALCQLNGVNTKDETQVDELLIPLFSRNKKVVDFYLSQVVFPRAAREFPSKLPTSAWDLVEHRKILILSLVQMRSFCNISLDLKMTITSVPKVKTASANSLPLSCNVWSSKILKSGCY